MYIVFARAGGGWTALINMGDTVNSPHQEYIPSVSRDGKYFFFTTNKSGNRDIYWMGAGIIEQLRKETPHVPTSGPTRPPSAAR